MADRKRAGTTSARQLAVIAGLGAAALVGLLAAAALFEHWMYTGKVLPQVDVDGADVAGESRTDAQADLARLASDLEGTPIKVRVGEQQFTAQPPLIGLVVDVDATVLRAADTGRGNPLEAVTGTVLRRFRPDRVPLVVAFDDTRVQGLLDGWANAVNQGTVEGDLRFEGTTVTVVEPQAGTGLRRDEAHAILVAALSRADRAEELVLPVGTVEPRVSKVSVEEAATRARALLAETVQVDADGTKVALEPKALAATLGTKIVGNRLDLTIDTAKLKFALGPRLADLEIPPADATFTVNSSTSVSVVPSKDGRVLDYDAIAAEILAGKRLVAAHLRDVHPEHDTEWAEKLGIKREVSSFTTKHPAGQPRVTNIHLAADALNNTVVEPGQTFSFNDKIGPRTPEKGYVKAPILVNDGFGEDYGGGVSQLVTTLYNAVFFGGYEDVEHSPHRFYISRYPMGREATINHPSVDLKFRNDTKYGVLVRVGYSSTSVTVTFFGDNEGRVVREENRKILKETPITDELISCPVSDPEDDPQNDCATLTAFEQEQVTTGQTGFEVEFDRVIEQPGQPPKRRHYYKNYPMLPNKVLIGTTPPSTTTPPTTTPPTTAKPPPKATTTTTRQK